MGEDILQVKGVMLALSRGHVVEHHPWLTHIARPTSDRCLALQEAQPRDVKAGPSYFFRHPIQSRMLAHTPGVLD